jgi:hypothetical protein
VPRSRLASTLPWIAACVLLAGAAHQAGAALGWLTIGPEPGQQAPGQALFVGSALLVLVLLGFALPLAAGVGLRVPAAPAIAIGAGLLAAAHFYSFDAYYAPSLRRLSDGGLLPGTWILVVVACALGAALAAARWHRAGVASVAVVCWLALGTAFLAGLGH